MAREHHDGHVGDALLERHQGFDATDPGQHHVEGDDVGDRLLDRLQPVLSAAGGHHVVALTGRKRFEVVANAGVIVDHEDLQLLGHDLVPPQPAWLDSLEFAAW